LPDQSVRSWTGLRLAWLGIPSLAYLACRLYWAHTSTLDPDEAWTMLLVRHSWADLFRGAIRDGVHPPLFYILLKTWVAIGGEGLYWVRLLPIALSLISIVGIIGLSLELGLTLETTGLALLLIALNPFLIKFAQELRMYSLLTSLSICSLWLLRKYLRVGRGAGLAALLVTNVLMVYTHYFGWVVILFETVWVLMTARARVRSFVSSAAATALVFLPWPLFVTHRVRLESGMEQHLGWNAKPGWRDVLGYFARLHGAFRGGFDLSRTKTAVGLVLVGLPVALAALQVFLAWRARRKPSESAGALVWLLYFSLGPIALLFALSLALPVSIFGPRYLIYTALPYLILCALSLWRLSPVWLRGAGVAAALLWAAAGLAQEVRFEDHVDWARLVGEMRSADAEESRPAGQVTLYVLGNAQPIRYALELDGETRFSVRILKNIEAVRGDRFWLAYQRSVWQKYPTQDMAGALSRLGYAMVRDYHSGLREHAGHLSLCVRDRP
jgi:mannosyltransferase